MPLPEVQLREKQRHIHQDPLCYTTASWCADGAVAGARAGVGVVVSLL